MAAIIILWVFSFLISLSEAKISAFTMFSAQEVPFCNDTVLSFLPAPYQDQTGFKCSPSWGSIAFKFLQDHDNVTTVILSSESVSGWVGIGFSNDGGMVGSNAVVGWIGEELNEFGIRKYSLEGKSSEKVIPDEGELQFSDVPPFVMSYGGFFYMGFKLKFAAHLHKQYMILALGSGNPVENQLSMHIDQKVMQVDFSLGYASIAERSGKSKRSHGLMGLMGWGALLPFGAIIARYFKHHDPQWFYLHSAIQLVGFFLGLAAVEAGRRLYIALHSNFRIHRAIGFFAFFLSILQVMALILRPDKASKWRKYWNWYHHWFGRLALLLGAFNVVIGIHIGGAGIVWKIGYVLFLFIILGTVIILELFLMLGGSKKADAVPVLE